MSRPLRWLMGALGGAALLFAVGPRTRVRLDGEAPTVPATPQAVADLVAARERKLDDIRPDNEARVTWGRTPGTKTPIAFVLLHGFSASRGETAPLSTNLARRYGANLFEARMTGHGRPGAALGAATAEDWVRDTREAIAIGRALGDRPVVLACSTGATAAMLVAAQDQPDVGAYVLISPNFGPKSAAAGLLLWPWAETWIPWIMGHERSWEPENEAHGKYWTSRYPISALFPMMGLVERARSTSFDAIRAPVLILHSEGDEVVDPEAVEAAFIRLGNAEPRERQLVDGSGDHHVIAGDALSPHRTEDIERRIAGFLTKAGIVPPSGAP